MEDKDTINEEVLKDFINLHFHHFISKLVQLKDGDDNDDEIDSAISLLNEIRQQQDFITSSNSVIASHILYLFMKKKHSKMIKPAFGMFTSHLTQEPIKRSAGGKTNEERIKTILELMSIDDEQQNSPTTNNQSNSQPEEKVPTLEPSLPESKFFVTHKEEEVTNETPQNLLPEENTTPQTPQTPTDYQTDQTDDDNVSVTSTTSTTEKVNAFLETECDEDQYTVEDFIGIEFNEFGVPNVEEQELVEASNDYANFVESMFDPVEDVGGLLDSIAGYFVDKTVKRTTKGIIKVASVPLKGIKSLVEGAGKEISKTFSSKDKKKEKKKETVLLETDVDLIEMHNDGVVRFRHRKGPRKIPNGLFRHHMLRDPYRRRIARRVLRDRIVPIVPIPIYLTAEELPPVLDLSSLRPKVKQQYFKVESNIDNDPLSLVMSECQDDFDSSCNFSIGARSGSSTKKNRKTKTSTKRTKKIKSAPQDKTKTNKGNKASKGNKTNKSKGNKGSKGNKTEKSNGKTTKTENKQSNPNVPDKKKESKKKSKQSTKNQNKPPKTSIANKDVDPQYLDSFQKAKIERTKQYNKNLELKQEKKKLLQEKSKFVNEKSKQKEAISNIDEKLKSNDVERKLLEKTRQEKSAQRKKEAYDRKNRNKDGKTSKDKSKGEKKQRKKEKLNNSTKEVSQDSKQGEDTLSEKKSGNKKDKKKKKDKKEKKEKIPNEEIDRPDVPVPSQPNNSDDDRIPRKTTNKFTVKLPSISIGNLETARDIFNDTQTIINSASNNYIDSNDIDNPTTLNNIQNDDLNNEEINQVITPVVQTKTTKKKNKRVVIDENSNTEKLIDPDELSSLLLNTKPTVESEITTDKYGKTIKKTIITEEISTLNNNNNIERSEADIDEELLSYLGIRKK